MSSFSFAFAGQDRSPGHSDHQTFGQQPERLVSRRRYANASRGRVIHFHTLEGFLLEKRIGINMPKRIENARILIANTPMDTDKVKIFGSRVRVDTIAKVAELELAEKDKMKDKVDKILQHGCNVFINR